MLDVRRAVVITKFWSNIAIIKKDMKHNKCSFPSFPFMSKNKLTQTCFKYLQIEDNEVNEQLNLVYCKSFEYFDYASNTRIQLDCYMLDVSSLDNVHNRFDRIWDTDNSRDLFPDEQKDIFTFFSSIPDRDNLNGENLYGQVIIEGKHLNVSLTNKRLLEMEINSVEEDKFFPLYFYEFSSTNIIYLKDGFRHEQESSFYSVRITDEDYSNYINDDERNRRNNDNYQNYRRYDERDERPEVLAIAVGDVFFSASPVLSKHRKTIVISYGNREADNYLVRLFDVWRNRVYQRTIRDRTTIESKIQSMYSSVFPKQIEVRIFNVGQANCCYADFGDRRAFFDIGITSYSSDIESSESITDAITKEIPFLKVDDVFVSHWDMDHILGVTINTDCLKNKTWIGPDMKMLYEKARKQLSISLIRLLNYLIVVGKSDVMLIDTSDYNKILYDGDILSVYLGTPCVSHNKINVLNNGGIIIKLNNNENLLLPGDCDNDIFPPEIYRDEYDHVLIPHHGSIMGDPRVSARKKIVGSKAYISVGKKTGHFRKDTKIDGKYQARGFNVVRTTRLKKPSFYRIIL